VKFKTAEQIEFIELAEKLQGRFGYKWTEIAKIAGVSDAMISLIRKGARSPGEPSLKLLRAQCAAGPPPELQCETSFDEKVGFLKENAPDYYAMVKATTDAAYQRAVQSRPEKHRPPSAKPVNSTWPSGVADAATILDAAETRETKQ